MTKEMKFFAAGLFLLACTAVVAMQPRVAWSQKIAYLGCYVGGGNACGIPQYPFGKPYFLNQQIMAANGEIDQSQHDANNADPNSATECGANYKPLQQFVSKTINIPAQCADFDTAFAYESLTSIWPFTSTITYKYGTGTVNWDLPSIHTRTLNHPFGGQMYIVGDAATPANVTFNFSGVQTTSANVKSLFLLSKGNKWGGFNGFNYHGPGSAACTANCANTTGYSGAIFAIATDTGSSMTLGPNATFTGAYSAFLGTYGATVYGDSITGSGGADGTIWGYGNGTVVSCTNCDLTNATSPVIFSGSAALADTGAQVILDGACLHDSTTGMSVLYGSTVRTNGTHIGQTCAGATAANTTDIKFTNSDTHAMQGALAVATVKINYSWVNPADTSNATGVQGAISSNASATQFATVNNSNYMLAGVNKVGTAPFTGTPSATAIQGFTTTGVSMPYCLGANNLRVACVNPDKTFQTNLSTVVASLPTCNAAEEGAEILVTDALGPTYNIALVGGGAVHITAKCLSTVWVAA